MTIESTKTYLILALGITVLGLSYIIREQAKDIGAKESDLETAKSTISELANSNIKLDTSRDINEEVQGEACEEKGAVVIFVEEEKRKIDKVKTSETKTASGNSDAALYDSMWSTYCLRNEDSADCTTRRTNTGSES